MEVGWTNMEEGFFCHTEASLNWNLQRQCKSGGPRKSQRNMTEEEVATEIRTWCEVKAEPAKTVCWHCFM
jgi:hypothetical protein